MLRIEVMGLMAEDAMQKGELDVYAKFQGKQAQLIIHTALTRLLACALTLLLSSAVVVKLQQFLHAFVAVRLNSKTSCGAQSALTRRATTATAQVLLLCPLPLPPLLLPLLLTLLPLLKHLLLCNCHYCYLQKYYHSGRARLGGSWPP
jgi:hypothetical protein